MSKASHADRSADETRHLPHPGAASPQAFRLVAGSRERYRDRGRHWGRAQREIIEASPRPELRGRSQCEELRLSAAGGSGLPERLKSSISTRQGSPFSCRASAAALQFHRQLETQKKRKRRRRKSR